MRRNIFMNIVNRKLFVKRIFTNFPDNSCGMCTTMYFININYQNDCRTTWRVACVRPKKQHSGNKYRFCHCWVLYNLPTWDNFPRWPCAILSVEHIVTGRLIWISMQVTSDMSWFQSTCVTMGLPTREIISLYISQILLASIQCI